MQLYEDERAGRRWPQVLLVRSVRFGLATNGLKDVGLSIDSSEGIGAKLPRNCRDISGWSYGMSWGEVEVG